MIFTAENTLLIGSILLFVSIVVGKTGYRFGVALVYFVMSALVKWQGVRVIERLFPPVVIGPVTSE